MKIYTEGDLDRVVIEDLASLRGFENTKVFPAKAEEERYFGKKAAIQGFIAEIHRGSEATLILDLDDRKAEEHLAGLGKKIEERFKFAKDRNIFIVETDYGRVSGHVLFAGLSLPEKLAKLRITRHQMEDYLLAILLEDDTVFDALRRGDQFDEKGIDAQGCLEKIELMVGHLAEQKIAISSKKVFDIFRAVVGFHASPATLAERVLKHTLNERKMIVFENLLQDITQ
jgi:hypothetical protein